MTKPPWRDYDAQAAVDAQLAALTPRQRRAVVRRQAQIHAWDVVTWVLGSSRAGTDPTLVPPPRDPA
jgi:hypothetical protein